MTISFKGADISKDLILHAIFFYLRYGVSYCDLEEIMAEGGVTVDHATLERWVERYACQVVRDAHRRKRPTDRSWRMDETCIKVKGQWVRSFMSGASTIAGIELVNLIRKGQFRPELRPFQQFCQLAA